MSPTPTPAGSPRPGDPRRSPPHRHAPAHRPAPRRRGTAAHRRHATCDCPAAPPHRSPGRRPSWRGARRRSAGPPVRPRRGRRGGARARPTGPRDAVADGFEHDRARLDRPPVHVREHAGIQRGEPCVGEGRAGEHGRRGQRRRPRALGEHGEADGDHQRGGRARPVDEEPGHQRREHEVPRVLAHHGQRQRRCATRAAPAAPRPARECRPRRSTASRAPRGSAPSRHALLSPRRRTPCAQTPTWSRSAARRFSPMPETWSSSSTDLKPPCCSR